MNTHDDNTTGTGEKGSGRGHADRLLDANLRRFAGELGRTGEASAMMRELSADDLASFKDVGEGACGANGIAGRGGTPGHQGHRALAPWKGSHMTRPRFIAGLSAAAALVAVAGVVFTTHAPQSRVSAATIINSLQERTISGIDFRFNHFNTEEVSLDGVVHVRLNPPVAVSALVDGTRETNAQMEKPSLAGTVSMLIHEDELEGVGFQLDLGISETSKWVHVRSTVIPANIEDHPEAPMVRMMHAFLQHGLMFDFTDFDMADFEAMGAAAGALDDGKPGEGVDVHVGSDVVVLGGEDLDPATLAMLERALDQKDLDPAARAALSESIREQLKDKNLDPATRMALEQGFDPKDPGSTEVSISLGAGSTGVHGNTGIHFGDDLTGIGGIVRDMLAGRATPDQLEDLRIALIDEGENATVQNLGNGQYLLVATTGDGEPGGGDDGTVNVLYTNNVGVESLEYIPDAPGTGSITITFTETPIDPGLFDSNRVMTPQTAVFTPEMLEQWMNLGKAFGQGGGGAAE